MALIQITDLTFAYPGSFDNVFEHVSFQFDTDWRLGLTGRNGRGKTTLLRLLQGQYPHQGTITAPGGFEYFPYPVPDASLTPLELLERSFPDVPEWRFRRELAPLAVTEDALYRSFSTLSGGEQQMLAVGRALMAKPKLIMMDEPSLGLAPIVVRGIFEIIREINRQGITVLLIEQNANMALKVADWAYVMQTGSILMQGPGAELAANEEVKAAYLGTAK